MENNLITPEIESKNREIELQKFNNLLDKYVSELNEALPTQEGQWCNTPEYGLVWVPAPGDKMGVQQVAPNPPYPPEVLKALVNFGNTLDLENVAIGSILIVKLGSKDPRAAAMLQMNIVQQILEPRRKQLQEKKLTVMFMASEDDISVMSPKQMEEAGWIKKDKNLIINPFAI